MMVKFVNVLPFDFLTNSELVIPTVSELVNIKGTMGFDSEEVDASEALFNMNKLPSLS